MAEYLDRHDRKWIGSREADYFIMEGASSDMGALSYIELVSFCGPLRKVKKDNDSR
ncbi:hypothetical protein SEA_KEELAN_15 [Gordonia phage Keelan]|nr:hypothetical protein SEA_KEELAN_15 [Gordonia phage Keelan]